MTPTVNQLLTRIDHVGIVVSDLDASIDWYQRIFGLTLVARETSSQQGIHEAMLLVDEAPSGRSFVQLLQPLGPDTTTGRFLSRRGPGIHHIAYGVADIAAAVSQLEEADVRLVDPQPRIGGMGALISFIHPAAAEGTLIELVQSSAGQAECTLTQLPRTPDHAGADG